MMMEEQIFINWKHIWFLPDGLNGKNSNENVRREKRKIYKQVSPISWICLEDFVYWFVTLDNLECSLVESNTQIVFCGVAIQLGDENRRCGKRSHIIWKHQNHYNFVVAKFVEQGK